MTLSEILTLTLSSASYRVGTLLHIAYTRAGLRGDKPGH